MDRIWNFEHRDSFAFKVFNAQWKVRRANELFSLSFAQDSVIVRSLYLHFGVLAQLVERLNGIEEVRGSNPLGSNSLDIKDLD